MSALIADDGFAGAGGWDLAAAQLGIHARGIENMKEARVTRDAAGLTTIHDDVWTFVPDGKAVGKIDSPPCQTFSAAGKGSGRKALEDVLRGIRDRYYTDIDHLRFLGAEVGDERTALVLTPMHFATQYDYEWLAWEQVPTVLPVWEACADVLREQGWSVWTGLLQAEMFGVPQTRKRAFLLASRTRDVKPPTPTHSRYYSRTPGKLDPGVQKWVSMAEALGWGCEGDCTALRNNNTKNAAVRSGDTPAPTLYFGQRCNYCAWEPTHMRSNYGTGGDPAKRGERLLTEPAPTITSKIDRNKWLSSPSGITGPVVRSVDHPAATVTGADNHYVFPADEWADRNPDRTLPDSCHNHSSTTIVGSFKPEIVAAPGYRTTVSGQVAPNSVRVTVEEAGVLQSFPADYPWKGARGKQFLQCGNAVPPLLAMHALAAASGISVQEVAA